MNDQPVSEKVDEVVEAAAEATSSITNDVRALGEKLAAALRAAGSTPEADAVKHDLRDGMEALQKELSSALQKVPKVDEVQEGVKSGGEKVSGAAQGAAQTMRVEVANLLRQANGALERVADALSGAAKAGDGPDQPA
jgi:hypothetical protein